MKILINYDFFNAIRDVNEAFTPFKVIRNNKKRWVLFNIPALTWLEYIAVRDQIFRYLPLAFCIHFTTILGLELMEYKIVGDKYKEKAVENLKFLVPKLETLNVSTSFELLKKSTCYHKVCNLKLNNRKLPQLIESKYILVPSYDYKGDIVDKSILQRHVIGQNKYELTTGEPEKVLKLVYNNA